MFGGGYKFCGSNVYAIHTINPITADVEDVNLMGRSLETEKRLAKTTEPSDEDWGTVDMCVLNDEGYAAAMPCYFALTEYADKSTFTLKKQQFMLPGTNKCLGYEQDDIARVKSMLCDDCKNCFFKVIDGGTIMSNSDQICMTIDASLDTNIAPHVHPENIIGTSIMGGMVGFTCDKGSIDNPMHNHAISYKGILTSSSEVWMSAEGDEKVSIDITLNEDYSRYINSMVINWM